MAQDVALNEFSKRLSHFAAACFEAASIVGNPDPPDSATFVQANHGPPYEAARIRHSSD